MKKKIVAFSKVKYIDWYIGIEQSIDEILKECNNLRNILVGLSLIGAFVGIIVAVFIAKNITKDLKSITNYADELAKCNLSYNFNINREDEIGETIHNLNLATKIIKEVIDGVKEKCNNNVENNLKNIKLINNVVKQINIISTTFKKIDNEMENNLASIEEITSSSNLIKDDISCVNKKVESSINIIDSINNRAENIKNNSLVAKDEIVNLYTSSKLKLEKALIESEAVKIFL